MMNRFHTLVALVCVAVVHGHTYMQHPVPFRSQLLSNYPMNKDGSDWPCSGEKTFDPEGVMNIWERGSSQYLQAMGGASHGGGSCQISVTTDLKPTKHSTWRVIHSIQGGCPIRDLTETNYGDSSTVLLPSTFNFTIPPWLPLGRAVMAWTWYGRWSVPEMFMNCAPIMVLGGEKGADTPDEELERGWEAAPRMFEANNGNGCWTANLGSCVQFPEPGASLEVNEECPFDPDKMFTGTCGRGISLANMSLVNQLMERPFIALFAFVVFCLLVASIVKVLVLGKNRDARYRKVSV